MTDVVLLFGRPAVGKFTIGKLLAEQTGYRLLHNHAVVDLVEALFPFGSEPFIRLREDLWLAAVDAAIAAKLPGIILTFAPESTVTDGFLPNLRRRGSLRLVELRCSNTEIERRMRDASRQKFGKLRDPDFYRELDRQGVFSKPVMPPADIVIDVTEQDATQAARSIAQQLSSTSDSRSRS
ncbi:MAG TPA: AAA family ATPase [Thermoanaerobaculia bacterium]|nr:AAA family ATPase [Thermoanaerobaculia bacterium]